MTGTKASALDAHAAAAGRAMVRFDYSGHGASEGRFEDGTISRWLEEAEAVLAGATSGPQILVGSSMGGWLALLLAERQRATAAAGEARVAGLVLIAPAVDMTRDLMEARATKAQRRELEANGHIAFRNEAGESLVVTKALLEDGAQHLFGDRLIAPGCPVHILQGALDGDVPWRHAAKLASRIPGDDVVFTLIKDGDHRLSRPQDLERILAAVDGILAEAGS